MKIDAQGRKNLNKLPALVELNRGYHSLSEYHALFQALMEQADKHGVAIMTARNDTPMENGSEYYRHPLSTLQGEDIENSFFIRSLYYPEGGDKVEFTGYFS